MAKKSRVSVITILVAASGWIVSLFIGVLELPSKINSFMLEAPKAKQDVVDWLNFDQDYTGHWTSSVEDWVDATEEERALSTVADGPMRMRLRVYGGRVEGEIETEGLKESYIFNNLLLEGSETSEGLTVWAYDYVDGKKRGFAEFRLKLLDEERLPLAMEVVQGGMGLPAQARLYRTSTDISEPIYRQPNMELLKRVIERGKLNRPYNEDQKVD
ncbi:hypothetical protein M2418_002249 [Rhizobium sp. BIGb0125]|uniref:hypothetical protein n=1 Tax=Rhizobium sp. BIGb0125 TaxID=2940618 RepID=UPI00216930D9|nr:hypothetical protein [Rhizobium sp. BIGb0125]MCS4242723.1 hypothetical protein [Rhizobium sp. BIGb0125]